MSSKMRVLPDDVELSRTKAVGKWERCPSNGDEGRIIPGLGSTNDEFAKQDMLPKEKLYGLVATAQEYRENRKRLDDEFNGISGLARCLRVDLDHGLSASQETWIHAKDCLEAWVQMKESNLGAFWNQASGQVSAGYLIGSKRENLCR